MSNVNDFEQLVSLDDQEFVGALYRIVLRREPDGEGMKHQLLALRAGTDKRVVAVATALSPEGRQFTPSLPGFAEAIVWHGRERSMPFGPIYRLWNAARRVYRLINRLDSRLANVERSIATLTGASPGIYRARPFHDESDPGSPQDIAVPSHLTPSAASIYRRLKRGHATRSGGAL